MYARVSDIVRSRSVRSRSSVRGCAAREDDCPPDARFLAWTDVMGKGINKNRKGNWGTQARSADGEPRGPKRIYVVKEGHSPGIYYSETKARAQLKGYSGCEWRAFDGVAKSSARAYLDS